MSIAKVEKWTGGIGLHPMGVFLFKKEALQLAKDLLDACGEPEPVDIWCGMNLTNIQKLAERAYAEANESCLPVTGKLAMLVANLAARMKEQEPVRKTLETLMAECTRSLNNR